jgi:hypothetical protein
MRNLGMPGLPLQPDKFCTLYFLMVGTLHLV